MLARGRPTPGARRGAGSHPHDLSHLGVDPAAARLVVDGEESATFTLCTRPAPVAVPGRAALVRDRSRKTFGLSDQDRRAVQLRVEGGWGGRSTEGIPDDFKLPELRRQTRR